MKLVQLVGGHRGEQIDVQHTDLRWSFDSISGIAVGRDVKRLVRVPGIVEVVGRGQIAGARDIPIQLRQQRVVVDAVVDRLAFLLVAACPEKPEERHSLAVRAAVDQRLVGRKRRRADRTRCTDRLRQVGTPQVLADAFER